MCAIRPRPTARRCGISGCNSTKTFSSEVGTSSCEENASKPKSGAPFRFRRNGKGSSRTESDHARQKFPG
ncbi:hypothetical protein FDV58_00100 [Bradyrhizobium elkanii]|uniref:Uncharacterized protein n=1 Tax=Bradyrhizobium elkanii TaxID=29448 RepID=A0A4U6S769_BRAEL|nr:hypothetical protein [Bradyrhizobium sp. BR2003]TKV83649.1 hypothetical protein FDV58_00100 [Bradyrhizobium elkanii]